MTVWRIPALDRRSPRDHSHPIGEKTPSDTETAESDPGGDGGDERSARRRGAVRWLIAAGIVSALAGVAAAATVDHPHRAHACPTRSGPWSDQFREHRVAVPPPAEGSSERGGSVWRSTPPNILMIVTDDQTKGTMSVMPRTRALMVEGGTSFTNAYVTTPLCCPSRASILTGRYAHNHGVRNNDDGVEYVLDPDSTIERYLHDAGYRTAMYGKFLNGWPIYLNPPSFDRWAFIPRV